MSLAIRTIIIAAIFMSSTELAFAWSPKWEQCKDINNKDTADQALAACNAILKDRSEQPNYAMALRNRCGIKYTKGDYDGALADCNHALDMEPKSDIGYERRGLVWLAKGDDDHALTDLQKSLELNPDNPYSLLARGHLRQRQGDTAGGDADVVRAKQLKPDIE
jgi:tetratricopeptide (TPR) repeat protein